MSELALQRIRENIEKHQRGEDATHLDLRDRNLTHLPPELKECVWLKTFYCSYTQISDLSPLSALTQLQRFDCSYTQISDLSSLANLTHLQKLNCSSTQVSDLSPLANLTHLQRFDCSDTQVSTIKHIEGLSDLQELKISFTKILDLCSVVSMKNLREIYLGRTLVSDLSPLSELKKIEKIAFWHTRVKNISPLANSENLNWIFLQNSEVEDLSLLKSFGRLVSINCSFLKISDWTFLNTLPKLQYLDISGTNFSSIDFLLHLKELKYLYLSASPLSDFSVLSSLPKLKQLNLSRTNLSDIRCFLPKIKQGTSVIWDESSSIKSRLSEQLPYICVTDCPLIIPPVEFAQESPQAVRDYFEELGTDGQKLNEVKVLFLGEASAGKTSMVKNLMGEDIDRKESQTHGIRIRKTPFEMSDGEQVIAHLWDFGGQEVMHATHQFFLSQRSIYVLLLNSRNDDQAEKWLKHAASFGGRSPVLVVLNKIDENPSFQVDNKRLQEKYPQIRGFYRVSAATGKGMPEFKEALRREIEQADTRRTPFPKHWLAVKKHFSGMTEDYIESAQYRQVCIENEVSREFSQDVLLKFLHDLGVVINFRNLRNFDTQILNPLWLTNGVYRVINSPIVGEETKGLLHERDFDRVINDPKFMKAGNTSDRVFTYPASKLNYIVRVMQEFELCFQLNAHTYVVPQLLPVQEPEAKLEGAMLRFVIHFPDFLPDSVFPRLMVKLHHFIGPKHITEHAWRTGMILHKPEVFKALARVRWDKEDQKILIDVCGEERRRLLSFIRATVQEIKEDFTALNYLELVPIPDCADTEEYDYLIEAEKAGEKDVFVKSLRKRVPITDLLDGVEEPSMRDEVEQLPVKAFVSYSHQDADHLKDLHTALAVLKRLNKLQLWDDRSIEAGGDWEKVIFQELESADIVLCLVSSDFVASDFCYKKEFEAALAAHQRGEKTVIPVMLRKTDWQDLPLSKIQGVPEDEWITSSKNKDEAWSKVSALLRPALDKAKARKKELMDKRKEM